MAEIAGKCWGDTRVIENRNGVAVHLINVHHGGYCSWHKHASKYNRFVCLHGVMEIQVKKKDYNLIDVTRLEAGDSMTVPPGELHSFKALTGAQALEVYWVELTEDIERISCGGIDHGED